MPKILRSQRKGKKSIQRLRNYTTGSSLCKRDFSSREGPEVLKTTDGLAVVISTEEHHKKAEKMIRGVIGKMKEVLGPGHPEILTALSNVATVLFG